MDQGQKERVGEEMKCYYSESFQLERAVVAKMEKLAGREIYTEEGAKRSMTWLFDGVRRLWNGIVKAVSAILKPIIKMAQKIYSAYRIYRAEFSLKVRTRRFQLMQRAITTQTQWSIRKPFRRVARSNLRS